MLTRKIIPVLLSGALLSACVQTGSGPGEHETAGTIIGAGTGAVIGAHVGDGDIVAVAVGTLLGALLGGDIGRSMDRADQIAAEQAYRDAQTAPVGQTVTWENPDNGHYGTVTPARQGRNDATGEYCREFQQTVTIGGRTERAYGIACRQPDGSWRIVQ